tara:strand:+ start:983 stop:1372 length:390 start_codon:yes stop_codon:yes gene_type:complete
MAIYNSNSLDRSVLTTELPGLSPQDLRKLTEELFDCINEITTSLQEVADFEEKHGYEPDTEWFYRAKKKLRISTQFAAKIEAMGNPLPKSYKQSYQEHLFRILAEELDPISLKKIQDEASTLARQESNE